MNAPAPSPEPASAPFPAALQEALKALLGERVSVARAVREHHGRDESALTAPPPDAVVFPHSTGEVSKIAALCARHHVAMIPYGAGTSMEGHVLAVRGGVCIDLSQMNRVLEVHAEDLD